MVGAPLGQPTRKETIPPSIDGLDFRIWVFEGSRNIKMLRILYDIRLWL